MDNFINRAWEYIDSLILAGAAALDFLLSYLHFLGPIPVIFLLAAGMVILTRMLKKYVKTKRLITLEKDFQHWMGIREEAMRCEDREKGKILARNIDTAHLNRAYYDYFLEGLLLSSMTFYLPVISMAAYINEAYRSERLIEFFNKSYVLKIGSTEPVLIGALFCYIFFVLFIIFSIFILKQIRKRYWFVEKSCIPDYKNKLYQKVSGTRPDSTPEKRHPKSKISFRIKESTI